MRSLFLAPVLLSWLMTSSPAHAAGETKTYTVRKVKDVAYHDGSDQHKVKHRLDLYLPRGLDEFPVLFFVHGGAWMHGDKDTFGLYGAFAAAYAQLGIGVIVTNYRLSPGVKHPTHAEDVARAFAWTYRNVARYGGRADRIVVCGHSAGAHLVSLLTTDRTYLEKHKLTSKAIRGVVPISGPFFIPDGFLTQVFGTEKGIGKKASPGQQARKGLPPFLILCAEKELPGCGAMQAKAFCKALEEKEVKARLLEIEKSDHLRIMFGAGKEGDPVHQEIVKFVRENTK